MLILSREPGDSLTIGDTTVTVLEVHQNYVKLGIDAPEGVRVVRAKVEEEVHE